jgi:hypothetical protein
MLISGPVTYPQQIAQLFAMAVAMRPDLLKAERDASRAALGVIITPAGKPMAPWRVAGKNHFWHSFAPQKRLAALMTTHSKIFGRKLATS